MNLPQGYETIYTLAVALRMTTQEILALMLQHAKTADPKHPIPKEFLSLGWELIRRHHIAKQRMLEKN